MRRLVLAVAALVLMTTPALAQPGYDGRHDRPGYDHRGRDYRHDDRRWHRPGPGYRPGNAWNRHVRRCLAAYRSYNPRTDRYVVRRGVTARCRL